MSAANTLTLRNASQAEIIYGFDPIDSTRINAINVSNTGQIQATVNSSLSINATHTNVSASTNDTQLLNSNANRKNGTTIVNDSTSILYVKLGSGAANTSFWVAIDGKTTIPGIVSLPDYYKGVVNGIWESNTGAARITEMS